MTEDTQDQSDPRLRRLCYAVIAVAMVVFALLFLSATSFFWIQLAVSASALVLLAFAVERAGMLAALRRMGRHGILWTVLMGLGSAAALYLVFMAGNAASRAMFSFGGPQIEAVYGLGSETPRWLIAVLLVLVVGPCEELFWRGYVQRRLVAEFGFPGLVASVFAYGAAHFVTMNFMMIMAALVCGSFWAIQYHFFRSLRANMISHAAWAATIFVLLPLH
ncbi:MAG: CPBP family intramembrane glutamic endopeptidase [bacterium]